MRIKKVDRPKPIEVIVSTKSFIMKYEMPKIEVTMSGPKDDKESPRFVVISIIISNITS